MWDYFFEPLSDVSLQEVYESDSVIRLSTNKVRSYLIFPQLRNLLYEHMDSKEIMKIVKFNQQTKTKIIELMPEILKRDNRVLGVIIRGTDYRPEATKLRGSSIRVAGIDRMIAKCKFIMELYGYSHVFLATEDAEYLKKMKEKFGEQCLFIEQKRINFDFKNADKSCAELLDLKNGKEFGRRYLAVIQSLTCCRALLTYMGPICGSTWAATGLNDSKYEYFEIVTP